MTADDRVAALVAWWVSVYTRRLPPEVAERRQAELASDVWEQRAHAYQTGAPATLVALAILRRAVAGIPADLQWRHGQLAAARGTAPRPRRRPTVTARTRTFARSWWLILAALLGVLQLVGGVGAAMLDTAFGSPPRGLWSAYMTEPAVAGVVLIAAGLASRPRARVAGDVLIAIGALPLARIPDFYGYSGAGASYVVTSLVTDLGGLIAALSVTAMAVLDAAEARSLGRRGAAPRGTSRRLLALATVPVAALAATGLAIAVGHDPLTFGRVAVALMDATAVITLLAAIRRRDARPQPERYHTTR
jgi:hypothetical protein